MLVSGYITVHNKWSISPLLVSHNCHDIQGVNTGWAHTSRYESPLVCHGCGAIVPEHIEGIFRMILDLTGRAPHELFPPFTSSKGAPGAKEKYEAAKSS